VALAVHAGSCCDLDASDFALARFDDVPSATKAQKNAVDKIATPRVRLILSHEVINFTGGHLWFVAVGVKMNDRDAFAFRRWE